MTMINLYNPRAPRRDVEDRREANDRHSDFIKMAWCVMVSRGVGEAAQVAKKHGLSDRVVETLERAAQSGGAISNVGPSSTELWRAFVDASKHYGAFDRILGDAFKVSLYAQRVSIFTSVSASAVSEGAAKPLKRMTLSANDMTPAKATALVVMTNELIEQLTDAGVQALGRELRTAVAVGSDTALLSALTGETAEAMGADSFTGALEDIEELLRLLRLGVGSKPYLIVTPEYSKALAIQAVANGVTTLGWNGGEIAGVEVLVSDAQTADKISMVDATGLAVADGGIELRSSEQATIQMDTAPTQETTTPTQSQQVSMFQTNSRALLGERSFAVKAIRPNAYAHLTGTALTGDSASPSVA